MAKGPNTSSTSEDVRGTPGAGGETHQVADGSARLTTQQGVPVADDQNTLRVGSRGPSALEDFHFREKIFHFDHERIPERVVHARGYGAHGVFETYESLSDVRRRPAGRPGRRGPDGPLAGGRPAGSSPLGDVRRPLQPGPPVPPQPDVGRADPHRDAFVFELGKCEQLAIRTRMVANPRNVEEGFARRVADGLGLDELPAAAAPERAPLTDLPPSGPL